MELENDQNDENKRMKMCYEKLPVSDYPSTGSSLNRFIIIHTDIRDYEKAIWKAWDYWFIEGMEVLCYYYSYRKGLVKYITDHEIILTYEQRGDSEPYISELMDNLQNKEFVQNYRNKSGFGHHRFDLDLNNTYTYWLRGEERKTHVVALDGVKFDTIEEINEFYSVESIPEEPDDKPCYSEEYLAFAKKVLDME